MKHEVSAEQYSALRFERVWVREATFVDYEGEQTPGSARDFEGVGIQIEVKVVYTEDGERALVTLRASLEPPAKDKLFVKLSASVEGAFTVRQGTDPKLLQTFANVQAPVLLVPYLRSVITGLTSQSRAGAIIIPPLNMVEVTKAIQAQAAKATETPVTP